MLEESWDVNCSIAEVMIANMDKPNPKTSIGTSPSTSIKVKKTYGDILPEHDRLFSLLPHLVFIFLKGQKKRENKICAGKPGEL
jgi:hypothetical protein